MIIVYCESHIDPEKQAEYIEKLSAAGIVEAANGEAGAVSYEIAQAAGTPGKLLVVERWESRRHMLAHLKSPGYAQLSRLNKEYGVSVNFQMYTAEPIG